MTDTAIPVFVAVTWTRQQSALLLLAFIPPGTDTYTLACELADNRQIKVSVEFREGGIGALAGLLQRNVIYEGADPQRAYAAVQRVNREMDRRGWEWRSAPIPAGLTDFVRLVGAALDAREAARVIAGRLGSDT